MADIEWSLSAIGLVFCGLVLVLCGFMEIRYRLMLRWFKYDVAKALERKGVNDKPERFVKENPNKMKTQFDLRKYKHYDDLVNDTADILHSRAMNKDWIHYD